MEKLPKVKRCSMLVYFAICPKCDTTLDIDETCEDGAILECDNFPCEQKMILKYRGKKHKSSNHQ